LAGATAVVTGATSGIGEAVALALVAAGATVHGLGRRDGATRGVTWHRVELADDAEVEGFAAGLADAADGLDILVHSAGVHGLASVAEQPAAELERQWRVNCRAPYALTRALLPLLEARRGQVAFLNSSVWDNARASTSAYAGSKYALKAFADALRAEVNPAGLRVLSLYPGRTATPMQAELHRAEGAPWRPEALLQPADVATMLLAALALPRTAEVTDIHIRPARKAGG
jgi:NADP-dependent 3-hydroxy acid dehydrogenase YdfG